MPEEIKSLLRVLVDEYADMKDLVHQLDEDVKRLAARFRRDKAERIAIVVILLALVAGIGLYVYDALNRRAEFRQQLRDLACLAVRRTPAGESETIDDLRNRYSCPAFHAAPAAPKSRTTSPPSTRTATATAASTRVVTVTAAASTVTLPARTTTATKVVPLVRTKTRTQTRTVTVTASPSCPLLPGVLC